ncbi:MAG: hypothetical protein KTR31_13945 [Myxococcales bacterium]|nr:hypothetical protein [Myxococcales bacterium]
MVGSSVIDEPFDRVRLSVGEADVQVLAVDGPSQIDVTLRGFGGSALAPVVTDGELRLDYPCDELCGGDVTLRIPPFVPVDVVVGSGDLRLVDMGGKVSAEVGGRIGLEGFTGPEAVVHSTAVGRVELWFAEAPDWVEVHNAQGPISIGLPIGAYALELEATQSITLDPAIEVDPTSTNVVTGVAEDGAIAVQAL